VYEALRQEASLLHKPATVVAREAIEAWLRRGPTAVPLADGAPGLRAHSIALCRQVTTLDRTKLTERMGVLPQMLMGEVEAGLRAALDLD
jgi:mRNA-degrading endonuclease toxin of MazEF toxin-antitoxin module